MAFQKMENVTVSKLAHTFGKSYEKKFSLFGLSLGAELSEKVKDLNSLIDEYNMLHQKYLSKIEKEIDGSISEICRAMDSFKGEAYIQIGRDYAICSDVVFISGEGSVFVTEESFQLGRESLYKKERGLMHAYSNACQISKDDYYSKMEEAFGTLNPESNWKQTEFEKNFFKRYERY